MREFVESLKRLFENDRIHKEDVERQLINKKISPQEFEYIVGDDTIAS